MGLVVTGGRSLKRWAAWSWFRRGRQVEVECQLGASFARRAVCVCPSKYLRQSLPVAQKMRWFLFLVFRPPRQLVDFRSLATVVLLLTPGASGTTSVHQ